MIKNWILNRRAALAAVYFERYGLSLIYLYFAWIEFHIVLNLARVEIPLLQYIRAQPLITQNALFAEAARHLVALLLNLFTGILLLLASRAAVPPQKVKDVLVPLLTAFFNLTYYAAQWFPAWARKGLWPQGLEASIIVAGLFLCVIGPTVALWAILYLRRSFGVFVEVKKVVLGGPYRWVRHPMYLGYIVMLAGLMLVNFSAAYFILVPIQIVLLLYRARLEEARLCEYSIEYRENMNRTGFILPEFRLKPKNSAG
jgi:protein-S-isoprenylcysteine O-methyltransferase Ste14